jgi:hypothetical protein
MGRLKAKATVTVMSKGIFARECIYWFSLSKSDNTLSSPDRDSPKLMQ